VQASRRRSKSQVTQAYDCSRVVVGSVSSGESILAGTGFVSWQPRRDFCCNIGAGSHMVVLAPGHERDVEVGTLVSITDSRYWTHRRSEISKRRRCRRSSGLGAPGGLRQTDRGKAIFGVVSGVV
jgi:hypothetical protein